MDAPKISIYDTTLRDGSQGEGISFSVNSKIRVAQKLDQFGVDYIEAGWPGSNPRDLAFFEEARNLKLQHAKIAAFGSTRRANVDVEEDPQLRLLLDAETPVVTIFGKTWLLHVEKVIRTTGAENLAMIEDSVRFLGSQGREVIYDAEHFFDGYKDNAEFALDTLRAANRGGAEYLVLCDTNGGTQVHEVDEIVTEVRKQLPDVRVGMHCHNDCGLGVALSLAGVRAGAVQIQGTINGYGERNGNANLTSIIPNLALKFEREMNCAANIKKLRDLSLYIDDLANQRPDIRAPYVGASAFAHKGGVHADAASKVARSYEHIDPALVGNRSRVLVSDMSGRSSIMMKAREMGVDLESRSPELKTFLEELKDLEFRGYEYESADASFKLLLDKFLHGRKDRINLKGYRAMISEEIHSERELYSEATVKISVDGSESHTVAEARGPIGALDHALRKALSPIYPFVEEMRLVDFKVRIVDSKEGTDAKIRVQVESTDGSRSWGTVGASENIVEACWEALKDAYEFKILLEETGGEEVEKASRRIAVEA
ncbi:citramalate synthase [Puniceicoccus vermicola]|uniref:Citramalate synthase n=1 Tax=Puniceicoccus vermicola TaxID=388746 RepID=A0A7X1B0I2_9BACT|nr:citramalate synthase [Puniceicoccus vermicola]MBC2602293.1 citramalate synthase [Puniceicoccus vermicola]